MRHLALLALLPFAALVHAQQLPAAGAGGRLEYDVGIAAPGTPVTTMRANKYYINNAKIPKGVAGIDYDASTPSAGFLPQGYDTPVTTSGTLRPANCNQPWTGAYGVNAADFVGSMSSGVLTVTSMVGGTIVPGGMYLQNIGNLQAQAKITSQLSGTTGGVGTYQTGGTVTVGSITWNARTDACQRNAGNFRIVVNFVKMDYADPIVFPVGPGKSHLHSFFGNAGVNAFSTNDGGPKSITNHGNSTSDGGTLNRSSYWVPALFYHCPTTFVDAGCDYKLDGTPIKPSFLAIYYKGAHGNGSFVNDGSNDNSWTSSHDVASFPQGFRMLAGNSASTVDQVTLSGLTPINYECRNANQDSDFQTGGHIPGTGSGASDACPTLSATGQPFVKMRTSISFPTCWIDTHDLDSPTHNTHVTYVGPGDGVACPTGYTTPLIGVSYQLDYFFAVDGSGVRILGHDPVGGRGQGDMKYWRLSSDNYADTLPAGRSGHGDWFNGWQQTIMDRWVIDCLRPGIDCHDDLAGADPTNVATPPNIFRALDIGRKNR